jgi:hypothetical protein
MFALKNLEGVNTIEILKVDHTQWIFNVRNLDTSTPNQRILIQLLEF